MPETDHIAPLIPWYVNGTLDDGERAGVERHVENCATCRELLRTARGHDSVRTLGHGAIDHPHPSLLIDYVDAPGTLGAEQREWIESRLAACEDCRESVERLRETAPERLASNVEDKAARPSAAERLWSWLGGTLLQPAAGAAYLLALLLGGAWMIAPRGPADGTQPAASLPRVTVVGDRQVRTTPDVSSPEPLTLPRSAAGVLLELDTTLRESDLRSPGVEYLVELRRRGAPPDAPADWSEGRGPDEFTYRDGAARLTILVYPDRWPRDAVYELAVRAVKPGDPIDGQALFRRPLRATR